MLALAQLLDPLHRHRGDAVVVTTMSPVRPWGRLSDHPLDLASADSAMGHAADLALGIALARPERRVVCLNGDGSMLMSLGTLVTAAASGAVNYVLIVCDNGEYEITGHQPVAGSGRVRYADMARAAGFRRAHHFDDPRAYAEAFPDLLTDPGPALVHVRVAPGEQGPIGRSDREEAAYLRVSLAESAASVRQALLEGGTDAAPPPGSET